MPVRKPVKTARPRSLIVAVISTAAEFRRAEQMSNPPDLFELRLDQLYPAKGLEKKTPRLPAPVIITARHPAEGGENNLPAAVRRELISRFLPGARYLDIELRSAKAFRELLKQARRHRVKIIISFHDSPVDAEFGQFACQGCRRPRLWARRYSRLRAGPIPRVQLSRLDRVRIEDKTGAAGQARWASEDLALFREFFWPNPGPPWFTHHLGNPESPAR